jgi:hypothetical protein
MIFLMIPVITIIKIFKAIFFKKPERAFNSVAEPHAAPAPCQNFDVAPALAPTLM